MPLRRIVIVILLTHLATGLWAREQISSPSVERLERQVLYKQLLEAQAKADALEKAMRDGNELKAEEIENQTPERTNTLRVIFLMAFSGLLFFGLLAYLPKLTGENTRLAPFRFRAKPMRSVQSSTAQAGNIPRMPPREDPDGLGRILNKDLSLMLEGVTDEEAVILLNELPVDQASRLYHYYPEDRIAAFLEAQIRAAKRDRELILAPITKLPETGRRVDLDRELIQAINTRLVAIRRNQRSPYVQTYKRIIENLSDHSAHVAFTELAGAVPEIESDLEKSVILFPTLYKLNREGIDELIDCLSNLDIAAILHDAGENERDKLIPSVPDNRWDRIAGEIDRLCYMMPEKQVHIIREAKAKATRQIRKLEQEQILAFYLDDPIGGRSLRD